VEVLEVFSNQEEKNMPVTEIKPIRPTQAIFNEKDAQKFDNYANQVTKTKSVGMDRMRQMMREFKEKRK
jgi:hypothetical protein